VSDRTNGKTGADEAIPLRGRKWIDEALTTPGVARSRSSTATRNLTCADGSRYLLGSINIRSVSTRSALKPGSTSYSAARLLPVNTAAYTSINAIATSATTIPRRSRE